MASLSSLKNFTVPLPAGGASNTAQGLLMPKLKYRFRVTLENFGAGYATTELTKQVMNITRPGVQFENVELNVYNSKINYAGRYTWADLQLVVRDDVTGSVSKLVGSQIQKQFDFFEQSSAASGIDYKFTTRIELLDGGGAGGDGPAVLETFVCYGCYLQNTVYANTDYSSSDPVDITLTVKYDNAMQIDGSDTPQGLGGFVGRTLGTLATG
jgi:hypothetical protein